MSASSEPKMYVCYYVIGDAIRHSDIRMEGKEGRMKAEKDILLL